MILIHCYYGYTASGGPAGVGWPSAAPCAPHRRGQRHRLLPLAGDLGRHHDRPDRGVTMRTAACRQQLLGCAFLAACVLAGVCARPAASSRKTFTAVARVTLETDRVGNSCRSGPTSRCAGSSSARSLGRADGDGRHAHPRPRPRPAAQIPADVTARCCPRRCSASGTSTLVLPAHAAAGAAPRRVTPSTRTDERRSSSEGPRRPLPLLRRSSRPSSTPTLNAVATALEGRGDQLGENLVHLDHYLTQLNPQMPTIRPTSSSWPRSRHLRRRPAAELAQILRQHRHDHRHGQTASQQLAAFLADGTRSPTRPTTSSRNGDNIIRLGPVSRATLGCSPRTPRSTRASLRGLVGCGRVEARRSAAAAAHHARGTADSRAATRPARSRCTATTRPDCRGLPNPREPGAAGAAPTGLRRRGAPPAGRAPPGWRRRRRCPRRRATPAAPRRRASSSAWSAPPLAAGPRGARHRQPAVGPDGGAEVSLR